jgi:hypothetical protein
MATFYGKCKLIFFILNLHKHNLLLLRRSQGFIVLYYDFVIYVYYR